MSEAPVDEKLAHIARRLRRVALCAELDDVALADVARLARPLVYARGAQLHEPARAAGSIYLIAEGRLRLYREALTGRQVTLDLVGEGEVFRFLAREPDGTPTSVAEVVSQCAVLYRFPGPALLEVLAAQPPALLRLVAELVRALARVYDDKAEVGLYDVETRLARLLVRLATEEPEVGRPIELTHRELAWRAETRREEVTRLLRKFACAGLIATHPHRNGIVVRDSAGLLQR